MDHPHVAINISKVLRNSITEAPVPEGIPPEAMQSIALWGLLLNAVTDLPPSLTKSFGNVGVDLLFDDLLQRYSLTQEQMVKASIQLHTCLARNLSNAVSESLLAAAEPHNDKPC